MFASNQSETMNSVEYNIHCISTDPLPAVSFSDLDVASSLNTGQVFYKQRWQEYTN